MGEFGQQYICVGGNRHPSAADWDPRSGILAFGATENVALWRPVSSAQHGVTALLHGHTDNVTAIKFLPRCEDNSILLTGSNDRTIRIWTLSGHQLRSVTILGDHDASVTCLAVSPNHGAFVSGFADATIKVCHVASGNEGDPRVWSSSKFQTSPPFIPLALALHALEDSRDMFLAVAGTRNTIEIYIAPDEGTYTHQASLPGHDGWVRTLAVTRDHSPQSSDIILASASQDKHIRLWRISSSKVQGEGHDLDCLTSAESPLSNKKYHLNGSYVAYLLELEAILLAHEDWIYSISWQPGHDSRPLRLASASADNSVALWEEDADSGIWVCTSRLGEISLEMGSSTATGSTGGFWSSLFSPSGDEIASLGKTGSWRLWAYDNSKGQWLQRVGISGHTKPISDITWTSNGKYLLSTSTDQTTRLHALCSNDGSEAWREMARPQIHGYDLNCIASVNANCFVSGADEKLLRVFDEPRNVAEILQAMCGIAPPNAQSIPITASVPVLGLSNKAEDSGRLDREGVQALEATNGHHPQAWQTSPQHSAPTEDFLARHTLWPEGEKLYGHGYEIFAIAVSRDSTLIATSCKASSLEHAVIRLYTTADWREIKPALLAHSLTVTRLAFSYNDQYLLSAGRDRQWAIFERAADQPEQYTLKQSNPKAHARMILDAGWAPLSVGHVFGTAGRDKFTRLWRLSADNVECIASLPFLSAVTAMDIAPVVKEGRLMVATGTESGETTVTALDTTSWLQVWDKCPLGDSSPRRTISRLQWRPTDFDGHVSYLELAIAVNDASLWITKLNI